MTEREYVETLKAAAMESLDFIRETTAENHPKMERWHGLRGMMSTHTFIRLCDAWLSTPSNAGGRDV